MGVLYGKVTQLELNKWKETNPDIFIIEVDGDSEKDVIGGYFKKPDLPILAMAMKDFESDPIMSGKKMFDNCWLGGDERMLTNDECKVAAIGQLSKTFKVRTARIKNL